MLSFKHFRAWHKQFIVGWLILCIGGIGPLTYFAAFSAHQELQRYHLAILEQPTRHALFSMWATPTAELFRQRLISRLYKQSNFVTTPYHLPPSLVHFFTSGSTQGYLLTTADILEPLPTSLVGRISVAILIGCSAWLDPPEKPPSSPC